MCSSRPIVLALAVWFAASCANLAPGEDLFAQQRVRAPTDGKRGKVNQTPPRKPNIVLILTDDQDVELGSLNFMPRTLRLLRDEGAEFRHAYVTTPMCCPSRSSLLTGMYVHNHHVFTNNENCSSPRWQADHETRSFATYLSNAGYRTGYFGKYLNKYNGSYIPPGWREWGGLIMNSRYYNYSINLNGKKIKHGDDYHKDYYPDLIANDSVAFLRQSKHLARSKPLMLVVSFPAPHGPEDSAPQFSHLFFNVTTHHTPAYDYAPNPDKQWILQVTQQMQPIHREFTDLLMTKRLQTLQSVDDAVDKIYKELDALGELDNTYIIYTSDHGYHLGQFGLVKGKSFPFEFDVRVPFLVRGPNIEPGTVVDEIVLNLDVAPTLLDIAGVETPSHMDGRSILPLLHRKMAARRKNKLRWPDTFLIESSGRRETPESIAEARQRASVHRQSRPAAEETRPTTQRPENLTESVTGPPDVNATDAESDEETLLDKIPVLSLPDLSYDNLVLPVVPPGNNKIERLASECTRADLQTPCALGQKWHCVNEGNRWRKHKCKFQAAHGATAGRRKCDCYTSTGDKYTRLQPDERRMQRQFLKGHLNKDAKNYRPKFLRTVRIRRDTLDQVDHIMGGLVEEIHGLQKQSEKEEVHVSQCKVTQNGNVNCSHDVYEDPKTWRKSRKHLEVQIKRLRQELESLKEIRRHLHSKKPPTSYDASYEEQDEVIGHVDDSEEFHRTTAAAKKNKTPATTTTSTLPPPPPPVKKRPKHRKNSTVSVEETTEERAAATTEVPVNRKPDVFGSDEDVDEDDDVDDDDAEEKFDEAKFDEYDEATSTRHRHQKHRGDHVYFNVKNPTEDSGSNRSHANDLNPSRIDVTVYQPAGADNQRPSFVDAEKDNDICYCETDEALSRREEKERAKELRRRLKEERLKKKERKLRRKAKLEKECLSERMNCFTHDNAHWKTEPLWTSGPFCFCMNANNNTYSCIRTINATHNFLYCEFVTGLVTFYNLRIDPFEQWNRVHSLTNEERSYLRDQLATLRACRGWQQCTVGSATQPLPGVQHHKKRKLPPLGPGIIHPSASHLVIQGQPEQGNGKRKKIPKSWRRRKTWQNQWREQRQRRRRYNRRYYEQQ